MKKWLKELKGLRIYMLLVLMSLSACGAIQRPLIIDMKCQTIVKNDPTDRQVSILYHGDESDRIFLQRVLANDRALEVDCDTIKQETLYRR